jgi:hypothetical protein
VSYLTLTGVVRGLVRREEGVSKKTGEKYPEAWKVQIETEEVTPSGDTQVAIHTLGTDRPELFEPLKGKLTRVPVGVFAADSGKVQFYLPKARGKTAPAAPVAISDSDSAPFSPLPGSGTNPPEKRGLFGS